MAAALILCFNAGCTEAGGIENYASILQSDKYQIKCNMNYSVEEGGYNIQDNKNYVIAKDKTRNLLYVSVDRFMPNEKYKYSSSSIYLIDKMAYTKRANSKEAPIDVNKVKFVRRKENSGTDNTMLNYAKEDLMKQEDELYSMLGMIAVQGKLLPNYKVEFLSSGNEVHEGVTYYVESYKIVSPYNASLKNYYLNDKLVKCIKLYKDTKKTNARMQYAVESFNGYVVLNIDDFSGIVDDRYYSLVAQK